MWMRNMKYPTLYTPINLSKFKLIMETGDIRYGVYLFYNYCYPLYTVYKQNAYLE